MISDARDVELQHSSAADAIRQVIDHREEVWTLMLGRMNLVELIPSNGVLFGFVEGRGGVELVWLAGGGIYRLNDLIRTRRLSRSTARSIANRLAWARRSHAGAPRHAYTMLGQTVNIVASEHLGAEIRRIVAEVMA